MYSDINSDDLRGRFASGCQLIDVREADEYAEAHIPGAANIALSEFPARFDEIDEDAPVVLVCNTGVRSSEAALFLLGMGYDADKVFNLEDGTKGWRAMGYALEGDMAE